MVKVVGADRSADAGDADPEQRRDRPGGPATGGAVDREAVCRFLEQVPIDHATLQFCERFDEQSRIWNFDTHSHPYFELIFFIEGKANIDAGAETVNVLGFDVIVYPPGLLHAEHLELGRRQEIICFWVDTGPTPAFDHAIKLMDERGDPARAVRDDLRGVHRQPPVRRRPDLGLPAGDLPPGAAALRRAEPRSELARGTMPRLHPRELRPGLRHRGARGDGLGQSELPVPAVQEEDAADARCTIATSCASTRRSSCSRTARSTVDAVAERVGFDDPKYFARVFKDLAGMSPSAYRRANVAD